MHGAGLCFADVPSEPSSKRVFCSTCGYPLKGAKCEVCGGNAAPLTLEDGAWSPNPRRERRGNTELDWAYEAYSKRDHARLVTHCLAVEEVRNARTFNLPEGPAFIAVVRGASMLIGLRPESDRLVVESPVARLPNRQRVPAMRYALELSNLDRISVRMCLRRDWILARFVGRLSSTDPEAFLTVLEELSELVRKSAEIVTVCFDARAATATEHSSFSWDTMPKPRHLDRLAAREKPREGPRAPERPSPSRPPAAGPGMFDSVPSILAASDDDDGTPTLVRVEPTPPAVDVASGVVSGKRVTRSGSSGTIPAVLEPSSASRPMVPSAPGASGSSSSTRAVGGVAPSPPTQASPSAIAASERGPNPPLPSVPPPTAASPSHAPAPFMPPDDPIDALCVMLEAARAHTRKMVYENQPTTMMLLLRATVYRAVYEHSDTVPHAVAHLFHATSSILREIWLTAPGKRRGSMQIPRPEPALEVIDRILAKRTELSGQPPVKIVPLTSAQQAKEHLARYVSEIEVAPDDVELRHHIALGALCELLVRTKLPVATQQKLRGIVAHAARDGAKQGSLDLMITALKRIIG
jgi:hypothetical protein